MRPLYETKDDLNRETSVVNIIEKAWNCTMTKLPIRYHLDYVARRGDKAVAFCEIKTRNYTMAQIDSFGGYLMSIGKWSSAESLHKASGLPFSLVVHATDGIYYSTFKEFIPDDVLVRGRTDRNDWQDIEPCVLLNTNRFTKLEELS
jgi:hypothetical protein